MWFQEAGSPKIEHERAKGYHPSLYKVEMRHEYCQSKDGGLDAYRESAQLARTTLLPDSQNLGHLARDAESTRTGLEKTHGLGVKQALCEQGADGAGKDGYKQGGESGPPAIVENQHGDDNVLAKDEGGLAVGGEGEAIADVVGQRDEVAGRLEQVREEADARGGARPRQVDDLRHLDHRRGRHDTHAQRLGHGELEAFCVSEVDVQHERGVALVADQGHAQVPDRGREIVRDGLQHGLQGVAERFHLGWANWS